MAFNCQQETECIQLETEGVILPRRFVALGDPEDDVVAFNYTTQGIGDAVFENGVYYGDYRQGDRVQEERLDINFHFWCDRFDREYHAKNAQVRLLIVRENTSIRPPPTDGDATENYPSLEEILDIPGNDGKTYTFLAHHNWKNRKRFTILYDTVHQLPPGGIEDTDEASRGNMDTSAITVQVSLDLDRELTCQLTTHGLDPFYNKMFIKNYLDKSSIFCYAIQSSSDWSRSGVVEPAVFTRYDSCFYFRG